MRNVTYRNVTLGKVVGDAFISLTTSYGVSSEGRDAVPLTEIQGIRYERIRKTASYTSLQYIQSKFKSEKHATAGIWDCFEGRPCEDVELTDVNLASSTSSTNWVDENTAWSCENVGKEGTRVDNVVPSGLSKCLGIVT